MPQRAGQALLALLALLAVSGCDANRVARTGNYTITVATADDSRAAAFAGTYQFFREGERMTRDLSGTGTLSISFYAEQLAFVRVHGSSPDGLYSLKISRDGEILYDSPAVTANNPILYNPDSGGSQ
jgi:hypothetical protein